MLPFLSLLFIEHYELEPDFPCLPWYAQQIRTAEGHCSGTTDVSTTYAWGRGGLRVGGVWQRRQIPPIWGSPRLLGGSQLTIKAPPTADAICIWLLAQHIYLRHRISALWSFTILETFQLYFSDMLML